MPPFADLLEQLVGADPRAGAFVGRLVESRGGRDRRIVEKTAVFDMRFEQDFHTVP